jgi:hypothetical protein
LPEDGAALIAAFTAILWPEAETVSDPQGREGWQPGNYFASRCKAALPQKPVAPGATDQKTRGGGGK